MFLKNSILLIKYRIIVVIIYNGITFCRYTFIYKFNIGNILFIFFFVVFFVRSLMDEFMEFFFFIDGGLFGFFFFFVMYNKRVYVYYVNMLL